MAEDIVGVFIPIVGMIGGFLLAFASMLQRRKRRELMHEERMRALELGYELPPLTEEPIGDPYGNLKAAIVLLFFAAGVYLIARVLDEWEMLAGVLPIGSLGLAFLVIHLTIPKAAFRKKPEGLEAHYRLPPASVTRPAAPAQTSANDLTS